MFEELEAQRGDQARRIASGLIARYSDNLSNTLGIYMGHDNSLGDGFEYDDEGNVIEPEDGFWKAGMPVGGRPIRPY